MTKFTKSLTTALTLIALALPALSNAAATYDADLAKLQTKWAKKRAKEQMKEKNTAELAEVKRQQKIKMLNLELGQTGTAKTK